MFKFLGTLILTAFAVWIILIVFIVIFGNIILHPLPLAIFIAAIVAILLDK
jgi:hypothetical protein